MERSPLLGMLLPRARSLNRLQGEMFPCLPLLNMLISSAEGPASASLALCAVCAAESTDTGLRWRETLAGSVLTRSTAAKSASDMGFSQLLEAAFWPGSQNRLMAFLCK